VSGDERFGFVQLEFPWALGPPDGRYVLRRHAGEPAEHVLVLATLGAAERRRLGRRRSRPAPPEPAPTTVMVGRATVVDAGALADEQAAEAWMRAAADPDGDVVAAAVGVLNLAVHAHRLAAADPHVHEVSPAQALVVRVGHGLGEQVADGLWDHAVELEPRRPGQRERVGALDPQGRLAALLGARDAPLACEELALRSRLDLDRGREREAALQLQAALAAAQAELSAWAGVPGMAERLGELGRNSDELAPVAAAALQGALPAGGREVVVSAQERLESALRARVARTG